MESQWFIGFAVALGIGLLIGVERERRKGDGPQRAAAGIRTFTLAGLAGFTAMTAGGSILFAVVTFAASTLVALAYWLGGRDDPGLTTEISLILTVLLGGLASFRPEQAAAIGVATAILLAARPWLHRFVNKTLSEGEVRDALILAAATFIVLPLLPNRLIDPFGAINRAAYGHPSLGHGHQRDRLHRRAIFRTKAWPRRRGVLVWMPRTPRRSK